VWTLPTFAQNAETPEIRSIQGDLYQVRDRDQVTVFLVTSQGIALADPLNVDLARWLKTELATRFPGKPIRYVLQTGPRYDRASGGGVLTDTAEIVGHEAFQSARQRAAASLPPAWAPFDENHNGVLERSETSALGAEGKRADRNSDGQITPAEAWGGVSSPKTTFRTRHVIELGGRQIVLLHPGDGLGSGVTLILFPVERILFAPGVPVRQAPITFAAAPSQFVASFRQIERLPFDTVLSERGETGTVSDLAVVREYVEDMMNGVKRAFKARDTVEQVQASLDLPRFTQLRDFETRRGRNIAEVYRAFRLLTVEASGAAQFVRVQRGVPACAASAIPTIQVACQGVGGPTFAGTGGVAAMVGRVGGSVEFSGEGTITGTHQQFGSDVISFTHREKSMAFMFRFDATPARRLRIAVTAGEARITATQSRQGTLFFWLPPFEEVKTSVLAHNFGSDVTFSTRHLNLIVPIRVTREPARLYEAVGSVGPKWNLRVGIGLAIPLARVVL